MASIWKKRGSWYLRPKRAPGSISPPVVTCLGPISDDQALDMKAQVERRERAARAPSALPGLLSLGDVIDSWLDDRRLYTAASTIRYCYKTHTDHFRRLLPVSERVAGITSDDVRRYIGARLAEGTSKQTCDKERTSLSQIFKWAMRQDPPLAERNPVLSVPRFNAPQKRRDRCSYALFREVVSALRKDAAAREGKGRRSESWIRTLAADVIEAFWWTGWRLGEGTRLTVGDVDADAWTVPIRSARNKGPADKFPIPPEVVTIMKRRIRVIAARSPAGSGKPDPTAHIFGLEDGREAYKALSLFRKRWCKTKGHESHRTAFFHALRHAFTSDLEAADVHPLTMQGLTRHRTAEMLDWYSHRGLVTLRAAQARLSQSRRRQSKRRRGGRGAE